MSGSGTWSAAAVLALLSVLFIKEVTLGTQPAIERDAEDRAALADA